MYISLLFVSNSLKTEQFIFWRNEIVKIFPNELEDTYFVPYKGGDNKKAASGKLYDKYTNTKKKLKSAFSSVTNVKEVLPDDTEDQDLLLQLQSVSLDDDATIKELWKKTYVARRKDIEISSYFEAFKVLSTPLGSTLVSNTVIYIMIVNLDSENVLSFILKYFVL
jgi:hypothetical protein